MINKLLIIAITAMFLLAGCGSGGDVSKIDGAWDAHADEPIKYVGENQPDKDYYDGALPHAVGVRHYQAYRANRSFPTEGNAPGFTYNHQPYLAYWGDKFVLQFLEGLYQEHTPPTRIAYAESQDGRTWTAPRVLFPEYTLPEVAQDGIVIPAGTKSVMHQRMGWYVAPNGLLLASGFYSFAATPRYAPNKGLGIGRVVREVKEDGSFGPIYFVRYNSHVGWNESNTNYPLYTSSDDADFVAACESLLADKLVTLQWWEEDRGEDGFFVINPSGKVEQDPTANIVGFTTSAGAGKSFGYYIRPDGITVGVWKNGWGALSNDNGATWTDIAKNKSLWTTGAKTWVQKTDDGKYSLVHDQSATKRNRYPLAIMTSTDGHEFDNLLTVQGEVPPERYQGIHKNPGPQYVRGIFPGNGNPPGDEQWVAYSMNKEDIWVTSIPTPVTGSVAEHVADDFNNAASEADVKMWNFYMPQWAPISLANDPADFDNTVLELLDEEPYDYALAERIFPRSDRVAIGFRLWMDELKRGSFFAMEVQNEHGVRPLKLRFDEAWLSFSHFKTRGPNPVKLELGQWYEVRLLINCSTQTYAITVNGEAAHEAIAFGQQVDSVSRLVFRTGPYRGGARKWLADSGEPRAGGMYREDLPGSEAKFGTNRFYLDDVNTSAVQ